MRNGLAGLLMFLLCSSVSAQSETGLKVFISIDMEGLTGVTHGKTLVVMGRTTVCFGKS